jgi:hypothetical protein
MLAANRETDELMATVAQKMQARRSTHPRAAFAESEAAVEEHVNGIRARLVEGAVAGREVPREAKIVPVTHDPDEPPLVVRAKPVTRPVTEPEPRPLPTRTVPEDSVEQVAVEAAEPEPMDYQLAKLGVAGYAAETDLTVYPEILKEEVVESAAMAHARAAAESVKAGKPARALHVRWRMKLLVGVTLPGECPPFGFSRERGSR